METEAVHRIESEVAAIRQNLDNLLAEIHEDFPLADELVAEIEKSRTRQPQTFVSHEEMRRRFG